MARVNRLFYFPLFVASILCGQSGGWKAAPEVVQRAMQGHPEFVYREEDVPPYEIPDPMTSFDGTRITDSVSWRKKRRPELLRFFERTVYGKAPGRPRGLRFDVFDRDPAALNGKASRKQVAVSLKKNDRIWSMDVLLFLPSSRTGPVPVFLILNFDGNHTVTPDTAVRIRPRWIWDRNRGAVFQTPEASERGKSSLRYSTSVYPIEKILDRGYGLATAYYEDIEPDFEEGFQYGVLPLFFRKGQIRPLPEEWGAFAAWAWGLSRVMDYLERDPDVDSRRVAVAGFSRLGKAALWAGAKDERFAMVVSNESGCGGAALSKRIFGETIGRILNAHPRWFCGNFQRYGNNEALLPVDQHLLLALVAPRPLYVASADEDLWIDPRGEFLSALAATPVYRLFGFEGLSANSMPGLDEPIMEGRIGYHVRTGRHALGEYDWDRFLDFADKNMKIENG